MLHTKGFATNLVSIKTEITKKGNVIVEKKNRITNYSPESLLEEVVRNNVDALKVLEKIILKHIRNLMRKNFQCPVVEERDILQEVLMAILLKRAKGEFKVTTTLEGFLYSICKNKFYAMLKKSYYSTEDASQANYSLRETPMYKLTQGQVYSLDHAVEAAKSYYGYKEEYLDSLIVYLLNYPGLNLQHRECLRATYFSNESQEEIAKRVGYSGANSVKVRVSNFLNGPFKEAFLHFLDNDLSPDLAA